MSVNIKPSISSNASAAETRTAAKRGRKPKGDEAMTGSQRQSLYRARIKDASLTAAVSPEQVPRVALMDRLNESLAKLDDPKKGRWHPRHREYAALVVAELKKRYGL
ncbi:hypothetical protein [Paucibacter soli]|uniref:hypothetical protein n=1 Tax=Paucibacter soli TaxID=3133433 RepID=UPI0030B6AFBD